MPNLVPYLRIQQVTAVNQHLLPNCLDIGVKVDPSTISELLIKFIIGPVFVGLFVPALRALYSRVRIPETPDYDSSRDEILTRAQQVYEDFNAPLLKELAADVQLVRISETLLKNELGDLASQLDRNFKQAMWDTFPPLMIGISAAFLSWPSRHLLGLTIAGLALVLSVIGGIQLVKVFIRLFALRNNYQVQEIETLKRKADQLRTCDPSKDDIGKILSSDNLTTASRKTLSKKEILDDANGNE